MSHVPSAVEPRLALDRLERYSRQHVYAGSDPYDGLAGWAGGRIKWPKARQALIQLNKRSPFNLRCGLGVSPIRMAKALALFASGYARMGEDGARKARPLTQELVGRCQSGAWGYEFDVQTRWSFYPAGSPNIVATAFAVEALVDSAGVAGIAPEVRRFLEGKMLAPPGFVRYVPAQDTLIHNANLLGARALHRVGADSQVVSRALAVTLLTQRPDGTWPYGEGGRLGWVDNFHTAYVLLCLADLETDYPEVVPALERGLAAWAERCFDSQSRPRLIMDGPPSGDVHNIATALHALVRFSSRSEACRRLLPAVLRQALTLQGADGAFRSHPSALPYMRWNQAHMFRALAEVCHVQS